MARVGTCSAGSCASLSPAVSAHGWLVCGAAGKPLADPLPVRRVGIKGGAAPTSGLRRSTKPQRRNYAFSSSPRRGLPSCGKLGRRLSAYIELPAADWLYTPDTAPLRRFRLPGKAETARVPRESAARAHAALVASICGPGESQPYIYATGPPSRSTGRRCPVTHRTPTTSGSMT